MDGNARIFGYFGELITELLERSNFYWKHLARSKTNVQFSILISGNYQSNGCAVSDRNASLSKNASGKTFYLIIN